MDREGRKMAVFFGSRTLIELYKVIDPLEDEVLHLLNATVYFISK